MENIKNIAMRIRYDGTNYHGWQSQSNGVTVQSTIEKALSELTGSDVKVTGCSRTDAGVHALDYIFNFKSETKIEPMLHVRLMRNITPSAEHLYQHISEADNILVIRK